MVAKSVLLLCAQALLIQCISSQCIGPYNAYDGYAWDGAIGPYGPYGGAALAATPFAAAPFAAAQMAVAPMAAAQMAATPLAAAEWAGYGPALAASSGGGFIINSASPIPPSGVSVASENAYEGALAVSGALPFLGAIALEGPLPTVGAGAVTYSCGNGNVAILNEDINAGYGPYGPYGPVAAAELGYGYAAAPLAYEAAIAGPAYGYRGCGYGPVY